VLLLTGATGRVGSALLARLTTRGEAVRCLVRDPRRLGSARVRVQIALGDLADPASFRHALRGVRTVVHLAGAWRDQPRAGLEELNGLATWRLLRAAERAGVERFVFLSPLGAGPQHPLRVQRAKALAERAVQDAAMATVTFRSSAIYVPGESRLPLLAGASDAAIQPICGADVAACVLAVLDGSAAEHETYELAGPEELTWRRFATLATDRRVPAIPLPLLRPALRAYEALTGPAALLTWDEAARATARMTTPRGTEDAERLGVTPRAPADVLRPNLGPGRRSRLRERGSDP
jgi:uncharacterized protein YbjT (DUF2867 family)